VIVECGLRLGRMWNGHVKVWIGDCGVWTEAGKDVEWICKEVTKWNVFEITLITDHITALTDRSSTYTDVVNL